MLIEHKAQELFPAAAVPVNEHAARKIGSSFKLVSELVFSGPRSDECPTRLDNKNCRRKAEKCSLFSCLSSGSNNEKKFGFYYDKSTISFELLVLISSFKTPSHCLRLKHERASSSP